MARTITVPRTAAPDGIATVSDLLDVGVTAGMIARRCRPGGPWRRLQPGVVMLGTGPPSRQQVRRAAVALAGEEAVITGVDALAVRGVELPHPSWVRLLVPVGHRPTSREFVMIERTTRLPEPLVRDGLRFAPAARAAIDAARNTDDPVALRKVLALAVHHGLCSPDELRSELDQGNQRGSSSVRAALRQFGSAMATLSHAHAQRVLERTPLPPPRWNVTLHDRRGRPLGYADAWWDDAGVAWQIMSGHDQRTNGHLALTAAGVTVVRTGAEVLHGPASTEWGRREVIKQLCSAYLAASRRRRPPLEGRSSAISAAA